MPSIESIERFKNKIISLSGEPELRQSKGLPPLQITPPESVVGQGNLDDLLGHMPTPEVSEDDSEQDSLAPLDPQDLFSKIDSNPDSSQEEQEVDPLAGLFDEPVTSENQNIPSLDDLLGPAKEVETTEEEISLPQNEQDESQLLATDFDLGPEFEPEASLDLPADIEPENSLDNLEPPEESPDFSDILDDAAPKEEDLDQPEELSPEDAQAMSNLDDLLSQEDPPQEVQESFDPSFFDSPNPEDNIADDDFASGEEQDFPELAGFASTKEEDVEAFDASGEADEFQLGEDFEEQFGITADTTTDSELLNPALAIEHEISSAQKSLSLTEEEFEALQHTLSQQPLNLKIAIEELIGEKDVVFEDLDKISRMLITGASSKTLALAVGKILGRKISIPAGYEKGSGEDLVKQQSSFLFNLKTIAVPIFKLTAAATFICAALVLLAWFFLWKPIKANGLYDQGLQAIKQGNEDKAENLFAQGNYYWPAEDRYFQYARAFTDQGEFDRARRMYFNLLKPSIRPYTDEDRKVLDDNFSDLTKAIPDGLDDKALNKILDEKKQKIRVFYQIVANLLSYSPEKESEANSDIRGEVIFLNPVKKALLEFSQFETNYGDDGLSPLDRFQRADSLLKPIFDKNAYDKDALLAKGDNFLAWAQEAPQSLDYFKAANQAYSVYRQTYGEDTPIFWRFIQYFLFSDQENELLRMKHRLEKDDKIDMNAPIMASFANWLFNKNEARANQDNEPVIRQKTLEEEYGIEKYDPEAEREKALYAKKTGKIPGAYNNNDSDFNTENTDSHLARSGGAGADAPAPEAAPAAEGGGHSGGEGKEGPARIELPGPHPYPNTAQPFRPNYLDGLEELLLRAVNQQKEIPEVHYQLSRYYRYFRNQEEEKKALSAGDAYFQKMPARLLRLNHRPEYQVALLNRIGEIFVSQDQNLQGEKYFLESIRQLENYQNQRLLKFNTATTKAYVNLANLYYQQTPGADGKLALGSWEQAQLLYLKAQNAGYTDSHITYKLGVINYEQKNYPEAVKTLFTLEKDPTLRENWNYLNTMGNALFRSGNYHGAESYYRDLYELLETKRNTIKNLDVRTNKIHKALALRILTVHNDLAASIGRGTTDYKAFFNLNAKYNVQHFGQQLPEKTSTQALNDALGLLMDAQGFVQSYGMDVYDSLKELDITQPTTGLKEEQARILLKNRQDKGLIEANLQLMTLVQTQPLSIRPILLQNLEIFSRVPLSLNQDFAP